MIRGDARKPTIHTHSPGLEEGPGTRAKREGAIGRATRAETEKTDNLADAAGDRRDEEGPKGQVAETGSTPSAQLEKTAPGRARPRNGDRRTRPPFLPGATEKHQQAPKPQRINRRRPASQLQERGGAGQEGFPTKAGQCLSALPWGETDRIGQGEGGG